MAEPMPIVQPEVVDLEHPLWWQHPSLDQTPTANHFKKGHPNLDAAGVKLVDYKIPNWLVQLLRHNPGRKILGRHGQSLPGQTLSHWAGVVITRPPPSKNPWARPYLYRAGLLEAATRRYIALQNELEHLTAQLETRMYQSQAGLVPSPDGEGSGSGGFLGLGSGGAKDGTGSVSPWLLAAGAGAAVYFLRKRKS